MGQHTYLRGMTKVRWQNRYCGWILVLVLVCTLGYVYWSFYSGSTTKALRSVETLSVAGTGSSLGPHWLTKQQSVTVVPYANNPGSITSKRLPANVMSHLYTSPQGVSGHDIAVCAFTDCGNPQYAPGGSLYGMFVADTPGSSDQGTAFYYASASDPWYKMVGCGVSAMNGLVFHAPNQAEYNLAKADDGIVIWDQATDLLIGFYTFNQPGTKLPASSCPGTGPSSCAVPFNHSGNSYCQAEKFGNERDWGWAGIAAPLGGGDTLMPGAELSVYSGTVRQQELMQGQINHAIKVVDDCHNANNPVVFPNTSGASGLVCGQSGSGQQSNSRPPGGALLFLDYTDTEINSMHLPTWQKAYITALSHYGAYLGVTGGTYGYAPFGASTFEGSQSWDYAGLANPFYAWLATQSGITHFTHADGSVGYHGSVFNNIPVIRGTDVQGHMYMADPCVVKTLAGVPGGC